MGLKKSAGGLIIDASDIWKVLFGDCLKTLNGQIGGGGYAV
jgi:hypothetical protein